MANDNQESTRPGIVSSLVKWFEIDQDAADELVFRSDEHKEIIERGISVRSYNYYVANLIGEAAGLTEREGVEEDEEEDDDL